MIPVPFEHANMVFGKGQEEYLPLPAHISHTGVVTSCWELTDEEIETIRRERRIYISQLTFLKPLQPILPGVTFTPETEVGS